jgi:hypothetical protein
MAIVAADWTFTRNATGGGVLDYIGDDHLRYGGTTPNYITVIELHRWMGGLVDDQEYTGDDELDIINLMPSLRSTDNIITLTADVTITDAAIEHLYDGTIIQSSDGTRWDGIVNFGNATVYIQTHQNGSVIADDWWNLLAGGGLNADATAGISHRFLIKTINASTDIDGRRLIGTNRTNLKTFGEFKINGTSPGNNVLALADSSDLNNTTLEATVATWTTITNIEGYRPIDVNNDTTDEYYYSEWNRDTYTINQFYERMKYLTRDGSLETIYGLNGEVFRGITHQLDGTQSAGTFVEPESVTWTGGSGQLFATDSTTAGTKLWIQVLTGLAPTTGNVSGATGVFAVSSATERSISAPFCGASTGSALIGAYGFGIEYADLSNSDLMKALDDATYQPPNNVTFTVGGLIHNEDYVVVGPWDGSSVDADGNPEIDYNQTTHSALLNGAAVTSVLVNTLIPTDTPNDGTFRIRNNSGKWRICDYTSYSGSTYTITAEDFTADPSDGTTTPKDVWLSYLDQIAAGTTVPAGSFVVGITYVIKTTGTTDFTLIGAADSNPGTIFTATGAGTGTGDAYTYNTSHSFIGVFDVDRNLVIKVRDGGPTPIKEYITSATLTSTGGSSNAIRTVDA